MFQLVAAVEHFHKVVRDLGIPGFHAVSCLLIGITSLRRSDYAQEPQKKPG
jgi:hypothetical protein